LADAIHFLRLIEFVSADSRNLPGS